MLCNFVRENINMGVGVQLDKESDKASVVIVGVARIAHIQSCQR